MPDLLAEAYEVEDERKRHFKVFRNPATRKRIFEFGKHRHYKRFGSWRNVDRALYSRGGGRYVIEANEIVLDADGSGLAVYDYDSGKGIRFLFPRPPDRVTGRAAFWTTAGVEWKFTLSRLGLKTEATVAAKRGPRTYSFSGQMLGGLAPPNPDQDGNLVQPAGYFTMPRSYALGADGERYECGPWTRSGGTVSFDFDDTDLPAAAVPYVIDPTTTFDVLASDDDFESRRQVSAVYPPNTSIGQATATTVITAKKSFTTTYSIFVPCIRWDTSAIADDAIIADVTFRGFCGVFAGTILSDDDRQLTADWYEAGTPGNEDYTDVVGTDAHSGTLITSILEESDNDFGLINVDANINRTGYTGLRLHVSGDAPTGANIVDIASFDNTLQEEPRLIVSTEDTEKNIGLKYVRKGTSR